jgi:single-stranded-DNA-specific exonuclease
MRWRILGKLKKEEKKARQEELIKVLFKNRGLVSQRQKEKFLDPPHPRYLTLKEMAISSQEVKKAILRIQKAIAGKEEIIVYGDYDADGVSATAILWETLDSLGARVMPHIPNRTDEGYGLNVETIKKLKAKNPSLGLIVTVDQGIVAHGKIDFARSLGIDVIVTDHHQPAKTKPKALAVIHTTQLAGAGVSWVLARELVKNEPVERLKVLKQLELAAIGTITDLLSLVGSSRSLVKWGLKELNQSQRLGLKFLFKEAGIEKGRIGTYEIGFIIGPRLNATGRIENALESLRLLCTRNRERADYLAKKLGEINRRRQKLMEKTAFEAREAWLAQRRKGAKLAFVDGEGWEEGVIGLAASKLVEEFYLPVVVISRGKNQSRASARSVDGFNIVEAFQGMGNLLIDAGGHPMAAGFTIETKNLAKVKQKLVAIAEQRLNARILERTLKIDCEIDFNDLNFAFFSQLKKFAPFGVGNPQPDFVTRGLEAVKAGLVGKENQHLKLMVQSPKSSKSFPAIGFGMGEYFPQLSPGKKIDLAYNLTVNEWGGEKKLELKIKDLKTR